MRTILRKDRSCCRNQMLYGFAWTLQSDGRLWSFLISCCRALRHETSSRVPHKLLGGIEILHSGQNSTVVPLRKLAIFVGAEQRGHAPALALFSKLFAGV